MGIFQLSTGTEGKAPALNIDILPGQLAINKADGKIYVPGDTRLLLYLEGNLLLTSEYSETSSTQVTLNTALTVGQTLTFVRI